METAGLLLFAVPSVDHTVESPAEPGARIEGPKINFRNQPRVRPKHSRPGAVEQGAITSPTPPLQGDASQIAARPQV